MTRTWSKRWLSMKAAWQFWKEIAINVLLMLNVKLFNSYVTDVTLRDKFLNAFFKNVMDTYMLIDVITDISWQQCQAKKIPWNIASCRYFLWNMHPISFKYMGNWRYRILTRFSTFIFNTVIFLMLQITVANWIMVLQFLSIDVHTWLIRKPISISL